MKKTALFLFLIFFSVSYSYALYLHCFNSGGGEICISSPLDCSWTIRDPQGNNIQTRCEEFIVMLDPNQPKKTTLYSAQWHGRNVVLEASDAAEIYLKTNEESKLICDLSEYGKEIAFMIAFNPETGEIKISTQFCVDRIINSDFENSKHVDFVFSLKKFFEESNTNYGFNCFPNPCLSDLSVVVDLNEYTKEDGFTLALVDNEGKVIFTEDVINHSIIKISEKFLLDRSALLYAKLFYKDNVIRYQSIINVH